MSDCIGCADVLRDGMAEFGCEITVSTAPPLVFSVWTECFTCPHGVRYYIEPTSEQRAAWARDGVR
jgi:hypothetical protein